ncbi:MAG TPA: acyltransferase family protein [Rhodocyclaceae bacterium]|nr:acyltransferase family protein [Rhodocyclaceae bacterium]
MLHHRFPLVDGLKALAIQFIVLHHLAAYGPLADTVAEFAPRAIAWFYDYARMAVQIFLVAGGYLAARSLAPTGQGSDRGLADRLIARYLRLAPLYLAGLVLAVICAAVARHWLGDDEFIPAAPTLPQALSHLLLLHSLLGHESLSAGVWYVAIDFQLFALLALIVRTAGTSAGRLVPLLTAALAAASLLWFNRDSNYDVWGIYFFGAYGLGALTYWAGQAEKSAQIFWRGLLGAALLSLSIDPRGRLLVALVTALTLHFAEPLSIRMPSAVRRLGQLSYSLFVVHFPIYLLTSAVLVHYREELTLVDGIVGMVLTWSLSLCTAALLQRWFGKGVPLARWRHRSKAQPGSGLSRKLATSN